MPATQEAVEAAVAACGAADDKQAGDLQIIEVADVLAIVDVFMLATATNDRMLKAVVDAIEDRLRADLDRKPVRREGTPDSGWVLLDYGDIVCHLFSSEQRNFYSLERLWSDVPRYDPVTGERTAANPAEHELPTRELADADTGAGA